LEIEELGLRGGMKGGGEDMGVGGGRTEGARGFDVVGEGVGGGYGG